MSLNITDEILGFFHDIQWVIVFKDVTKFYIYLIIFYGLAFLLIWGHMFFFP